LIAKVSRGDLWARTALEVYRWKDMDNPAAGGVEHVLTIPRGWFSSA
jgi:hypothetical protein